MPKFERYQKLQKYKNGVPVDPPEYKQGELIDTAEFPSKEECENLVRYRWIDTGRNICKEYQLVNEEKEQKSTDKGLTWIDTGKVRGGNRIIDEHATQCGWELKERWRDTGELVCHGYNKAKKITKEVSYDMGKTWQQAVPPEYKFEDTEVMSDDCILQSEPFTYEFEGNTWDGNVYIRAYKRYVNNSINRAYFKYFIRWDKGEYVVRVEDTIDGGALNQKIAQKVYSTSGKHTVTIWGCIKSFKGTVKSIVSWGSPFKGKMSYVDYYYSDYMINLYDINITADSIAPDKNNALVNATYLGLHTLMEELPIKVGPYVEELDLSDNPNLIKAPAEEGASKLEKIYFNNCTSLKQMPIYEQMKQKDIILWEASFKNCNSLTVLPTAELHMRYLYFDHCVNISDASGLTLYVGNLSFSYCTNLKRFPRVIWCYGTPLCEGSFKYCDFETFDGDIWNWEGDEGQIELQWAFGGCKNLKKFVGYLPADARPFILTGLFEGTPLESVSPFFKNVKKFPGFFNEQYKPKYYGAARAFANTNIKTLPNDFFNPEMVSMYDKDALESITKEMFAGCKQLTNYPILNGNPVWDFGSFSVKGQLIATYMFKDCPLIADQVISPWGGNASYVNPASNIIIETTGTNELPSISVDGQEYAIFKDGKLIASGIGNNVSSPSDKWTPPVEGVKYIIRFYNKNYTMEYFTVRSGTISVLNTGLASSLSFFEVGKLNILKGGVNLYKGRTVMDKYPSVKQLDPDFFINATEITSGDSAFQFCTFDTQQLTEALKNITTLTSAAYMFDGAKVISDCNVFANNPGLINAEGMFRNSLIKTVSTLPEGLVNMKECFKGCEQLTTANIPSTVTNLDSSFSWCSSLTTVKGSIKSATSMYMCFIGCTNLTTIPNILEGVTNMDMCFNGCTNLTTIPNIPKSVNDLDRCFEGCTSLTGETPVDENGYKLWERAGKPGYPATIDGRGCFIGCTQLADYDQIPAEWKLPY